MSQTKQDLLSQIAAHLEAELTSLSKSAQAAHEAATHEEAKPENKYDTRGLEASYLAGAQKERLAELQAALQAVRSTVLRDFGDDAPIGPTALVELDQDGTTTLCFLMLLGAGYTLSLDGRPVLTITTQSPLGRALTGKRAGDYATLRTAQGEKEYEILGVR